MTQQTINIGSGPNDSTGDPIRTAFSKVNANFTELYAGGASETQLTNGAYTVTLGADGSTVFPGTIYGGSNTIGLATPAPLNLNNTGPVGQVKTQLNLINTAGNGNTGSAIDYFTYVDQGNGLPGARLQAVDNNNYSANFSIALKGVGNAGNNTLTTKWTFGADASLTFPDASVQTTAYTGITPNGTKASNATGTPGQISWDANYIYVCTATNTWKRSSLTGGY